MQILTFTKEYFKKPAPTHLKTHFVSITMFKAMKGKFIILPTVIMQYVMTLCDGVSKQPQVFLLLERNGNERSSLSSVMEIDLQLLMGNWASPIGCLDAVVNYNNHACVRNCRPARSLITWKNNRC
jgi:hypothetical protein